MTKNAVITTKFGELTDPPNKGKDTIFNGIKNTCCKIQIIPVKSNCIIKIRTAFPLVKFHEFFTASLTPKFFSIKRTLAKEVRTKFLTTII